MFIKANKLAQLMKAAYKNGGLRLAADATFYSLQGRSWAMQIYKEHIPKEVKGEIVKLADRLPEDGEQFLAMPEGNQEEFIYKKGDYLDVYANAIEAETGVMLSTTQFFLQSKTGRNYVVLQGGNGGRTHILEAGAAAMIDSAFCEKNEELKPAYRGKNGSYYRRSDHMAMAISLSVLEELAPAVDFLAERDLIELMEQA